MAGVKGKSGGARQGTGPKPRPPEERMVEVRVKLPRELKAALSEVGGGNISENIRAAVFAWLDANWPEYYPGRRVEIWRHSTDAQYAVLCERGRPIMAAGPLTHAGSAGVIAGATAFDWSAKLADDINAEDEQGDEAAYQRVWSEEPPRE